MQDGLQGKYTPFITGNTTCTNMSAQGDESGRKVSVLMYDISWLRQISSKTVIH